MQIDGILKALARWHEQSEAETEANRVWKDEIPDPIERAFYPVASAKKLRLVARAMEQLAKECRASAGHLDPPKYITPRWVRWQRENGYIDEAREAEWLKWLESIRRVDP